jgi:predicted Rossmann fold nucleotide-binding protein DprA/Smf involved in DNA uptake
MRWRTRPRRLGPGGTIAVLGCGLDVDYPREHRQLSVERLAADHLPFGAPPGRSRVPNFPIRN